MAAPLFTDDQFARMGREVRQVLAEIGYHVAHPRLKEIALQGGCRESAAGRILVDGALVDDLAARLRDQYPPPTEEPDLLRPRPDLQSGMGNITPKFFNVRTGQAEGGSTANLTWLTKFAQAAPYVSGLTLPVSRQDVPPAIEQLDSLVLMSKLTDKPLGALDVTVPEAVPFVAAAGEALGRNPAEFVGSCNCINPPLRLEHRTAETMLCRMAYHSRSMITPMPCIGGSSPVDTYGTVIQGTAEIVGGLILSMLMDPQAPLMGYIASTQMDMRTGNITSSSPQTIQVDAGVYQLMEHQFGGGTRIGGRSYVSAKRPGMQAIYEKLLKTIGYAALADAPAFSYVGHGTLDNGSVTCPEQFVLDLEVLEGFSYLWQQPLVPAEGDVVARLREGIMDLGGNFLVHDHTLTRWRDEGWDPKLFLRATDTPTEQAMLDQAHGEVRGRVESYEPAAHPEDVVRELEMILRRAKRELLP